MYEMAGIFSIMTRHRKENGKTLCVVDNFTSINLSCIAISIHSTWHYSFNLPCAVLFYYTQCFSFSHFCSFVCKYAFKCSAHISIYNHNIPWIRVLYSRPVLLRKNWKGKEHHIIILSWIINLLSLNHFIWVLHFEFSINFDFSFY